ncbi:tripartite tricarboxylate transporter TctB family protein [Tessaracoccus sp. HDW20]|uniref:tripartite tricarboxylate transporter TctB family protein n=1 Tax=Tessaracoccus coleopterorum TaxID=2714950 RepID=UPI0018D38F43|nr:tripartite tricarboxylate transporter TctB family protein [Tessaracoccus coleopterorum]NHB85767.1 tripartite tricarboxylate transporter TctB family protein [Tessaracoccus coleopterorum]
MDDAAGSAADAPPTPRTKRPPRPSPHPGEGDGGGGHRLRRLSARDGPQHPIAQRDGRHRSRWWPTVISGGIILSGVWMLVNAVLKVSIDRTVDPSRRSGWIQVGVTVAALIAVLALWQVGVNFLVLGPAFLIVTNWAYGLRRWTTLLLFPAIVAATLYLVFQLLLKVPL